jgi:hypothetical protein
MKVVRMSCTQKRMVYEVYMIMNPYESMPASDGGRNVPLPINIINRILFRERGQPTNSSILSGCNNILVDSNSRLSPGKHELPTGRRIENHYIRIENHYIGYAF